MAEEKKIPSADKLKALQLAMAKIDKEFGKGAIMKLGDDKIEDIPVIPSGSVGLNVALGVGGYPRGRVIEIYGPESSGKTTLAIHAMAEVQKQGGIAAIIDAEHAFDRFYAEKLGVDTNELLIAHSVYRSRSKIPAALPEKSRDTLPSVPRTTRISAFLSIRSRQPIHCRWGIFFCISCLLMQFIPRLLPEKRA